MLLDIPFSSQINVKIFDKSRLLITDKILHPSISAKTKLGYDYSQVNAVFLIKDDVVLFIGNVIDRKFVISRIVIDGKTGDILSEVNIGDFPQYSKTAGYSYYYGDKIPNSFSVKKDPNSDNYGVALIYGFSDDVNAQVEFIHYSSNHLQISRQFITTKKADIIGTKYLDMIVLGSTKLLGFAQFIKKDTKSEHAVSIISIETGLSPLYLQDIIIDKELYFKNFIIKNDKKSGDYLMLIMSYLRKSNVTTYVPKIFRLNSKNMQVINTIDIGESKSINQKFEEYFSKNKYQPSEVSLIEFGREKNKFHGLPQDLIVNEDNTYIIIFEEMMQVSTSSGGSYTALYNNAVVKYDVNFNEIESYFVPKNHAVYNSVVLYMKYRNSGPMMNLGINIYSSFAWYKHKTYQYLFVNEIIGNSTAQMDRLDRCEAFI